MFRRKTGKLSHCIIQAAWVLGHFGTLIMETVAPAAKFTDLINLKRLLTQENFQNYKYLKMLYNIQIQSSSLDVVHHATNISKTLKH
jgi:hypothetical protein